MHACVRCMWHSRSAAGVYRRAHEAGRWDGCAGRKAAFDSGLTPAKLASKFFGDMMVSQYKRVLYTGNLDSYDMMTTRYGFSIIPYLRLPLLMNT